MFPHRNIHKCTWISLDVETHNQTDNILIDMRRHSNVPDVRSFRAASCDAENHLVAEKSRERLAVHKQKTQISYGGVQSQEIKNEVEGKGQYRVEISNRFSTL
jgi:hypothetical protein